MDYSTLKVTELKDELKKRGIPATKLTRKQEIIDRLIEDDNSKIEEEPKQADAPEEVDESRQIPENVTTIEVTPIDVVEKQSENATQPEERKETKPIENIAPAEIAQTTEKPLTLEEKSTEVITEPKDQNTVVEQDQNKVAEEKIVPIEEDRKRKRRSLSPTLSVKSITKKLKQAGDDVVHMEKEDGDINNIEKGETSKDVKMNDVEDGQDEQETISSRLEQQDEQPEELVTLSVHPITTALYIRDLVRPLSTAQLKDHIQHLASPLDLQKEVTNIFYLDPLRTHAFVDFHSISTAIKVRNKLHQSTFPNEPTRKPLWVDFIPPKQIQSWIEQEKSTSGTRPSQSKRWEISYSTNAETNTVQVELIDQPPHLASTIPAPPVPVQASATSTSNDSNPASRSNIPDLPTTDLSTNTTTNNNNSNPLSTTSFSDLASHFSQTSSTKPALYFLPVADSIASLRLETLRKASSATWSAADDDRLSKSKDDKDDEAGQLRRYTFQDGSELVDGGAEFGGGRAFASSSSNYVPRGGGRRGGRANYGNGNNYSNTYNGHGYGNAVWTRDRY